MCAAIKTHSSVAFPISEKTDSITSMYKYLTLKRSLSNHTPFHSVLMYFETRFLLEMNCILHCSWYYSLLYFVKQKAIAHQNNDDDATKIYTFQLKTSFEI